ncbi:NAD(P)/FAD-dependent oxidoreductase [Sphingopyxis sp. DBS4]|uniref:NAD(P)/FAD-dependent oxidoreductase n=1 Tax=Sphingopyxis sp. DBS4 TaxID=2968500 RepID=UPI00214AF8F3|nr:FAD-dependent oxidoreductase [Sphingopyxis sp. DBS4]
MKDEVFVVVGGGQAGGWIIKTLGAEGFSGRIVLIGEERHPPYERPPLSKNALRDAEAISETALLSIESLAEANVESWLGEEVIEIDRSAQTVRCASGREIHYDRLFLATGSRPRVPDWMAGQKSDRIHLLRTIDDAAALRSSLSGTKHLLIVGGGWIGLEVAATVRSLGIAVTVVEAAPRLCQRSVPEPVSDWLRALHESHGVAFVMGRSVVRLAVQPDGLMLELDDDTARIADRVLVCVGAIPNVALGELAGLDVSNGILVDEFGGTSDPRIFAAGDVACFPCCYAGQVTRRESWANAQNQAIAAAKAALGNHVRYADLPWLWSDQYGHNIQIAGLPERAASTLYKAGPAAGSGCWVGLDAQNHPVGAVGVDAPKLFRPILKALKDNADMDLSDWQPTHFCRGAAA